MLKAKTVVLGVTGCVAAYKACDVVSALKKKGVTVKVIMTKNACEFVQPYLFETLSKNRVYTDTFDKNFEYKVGHVSLAKEADVFVVVPATANVIGKIAGGIADDMLTTTIMACKSPVIICPAMNTAMLENDSTQNNLQILQSRGMKIVDAETGMLACGDVGKGRLADPRVIVDAIIQTLMPKPDYEGKKVLITAGATQEPVDGVRFITNHSSGKMGMALAVAAAERGAEVTLVCGNVSVDIPDCVENVVRVKTTEEMLSAVMENYSEADYAVMAAAPADYKVKNYSAHKLKSQELTLEMEKTPDIAKALGEVKGDRKTVIFSAETDDLLNNAKGKLKKKNADMVVANDVTKEGAGFNVDTNIATIITRDGEVLDFDKMLKTELADKILDVLLRLK